MPGHGLDGLPGQQIRTFLLVIFLFVVEHQLLILKSWKLCSWTWWLYRDSLWAFYNLLQQCMVRTQRLGCQIQQYTFLAYRRLTQWLFRALQRWRRKTTLIQSYMTAKHFANAWRSLFQSMHFTETNVNPNSWIFTITILCTFARPVRVQNKK